MGLRHLRLSRILGGVAVQPPVGSVVSPPQPQDGVGRPRHLAADPLRAFLEVVGALAAAEELLNVVVHQQRHLLRVVRLV